MTESTPPEPPAPQEEPVRARKGPPAWGIAVFLALLAGMFVLNQFAATSGPPVKWIENDLNAALQQVCKEKPRALLYLYDPADPIYARNEREIFTNRWARVPLAGIVCCRADVTKQPRLAAKYSYKNVPLFLLLDRQGNPITRIEGALTEVEFFTSITHPVELLRQRPGGGASP